MRQAPRISSTEGEEGEPSCRSCRRSKPRCAGWKRAWLGREIVDFVQHRDDLRFPLPPALPERLTGCRILGFGRRAKYILARLDNDHSLLLHLGMSGRLLFDGEAAGPHEHLTFRFDDGSILRYIDPRRFGMLDLVAAKTNSMPIRAWLTLAWSRSILASTAMR